MAKTPNSISDTLIASIKARIADNRPVRRTLPDGGRIHVDRQLPFLVLCRPRPDGTDTDVAQFVRGEASYLIAPRQARHQRQLTALTEAVVDTLSSEFGSFLLIEVWSQANDTGPRPDTGEVPRPGYRVVVAKRDAETESVSRLLAGLQQTRVDGRRADVSLAVGGKLSPPGLSRISRQFGTAHSPIHLVGIEIRPIHRDPDSNEVFPAIARSIHRQLSKALQQAAYAFALQETTHRPRHYQALGRRAMVKAVAEVDRKLAAIASAFDLLMLVTPANTEQAYRRFARNKAASPPRFRYRPLDVDPARLKRSLYSVPIERVEDPTLAAIFSEKQRELSLKLDLLTDRRTERFLHTGLALYGSIDAATRDEASGLLASISPGATAGSRRSVSAERFAAIAASEIEHYRAVYGDMAARVQVRDDISSLMVSNGHLLVGSSVRIPIDRVEALLQHEVGTHVVTYWNGSAQKLRLLATGLAGHDELQEGLAVLAEYLVAGLSPARLRVLAARVIAADSVATGAKFLDTHRMLRRDFGFSQKAAFTITTRVHRGGGLVKDAVYLRGLRRVVSYLADGGRLDTLLVGKISVDHVAVIEELQRRKVLVPPPLRPAYLDDPDTHYRLERLRNLTDLSSLVESQ